MRVYLAGPDVFREDAKIYGLFLKEQCAKLGMTGLFPLDNEIVPLDADKIFRSNCRMIRFCDAVVANISPFRGCGMDSGTAWELGMAYALNKQIYLYSDDLRDYKTREDGTTYLGDNLYPIVEDFGLTENLMITCSGGTVYSSFIEALMAAKPTLKRPSVRNSFACFLADYKARL